MKLRIDGSNSISVFSVDHDGSLALIDSAGSGGVDPISVTIHHQSVYVLNAGDGGTRPANIAGFTVEGDHLVPQPANVQPLNASAVTPEQISFSPDGQHLIVTEKTSNTIDVFAVNSGDLSPAVTTTLASGTGPYGFAFTPSGVAVVSEAAFGGLASFSINANGTLAQISQVSDGQLAACWVALSSDGSDAYTANAHSGTVSFYSVASNGTLTLNNPAVATNPGPGDTDLAVGAHNGTLDIFDGHQIDATAIATNGTLGASNPAIIGLAAGTEGLVATN